MSNIEFIKWLKGFISVRKLILNKELDEIKNKLNTVNVEVPLGGTTVTYPQIDWVQSTTHSNKNIKINYADNRSNKKNV
jgi:hypothetical protein